MKSRMIYLLMMLLSCASINNGAAQIRLGAKAGLNLANQHWNGYGGGVDTKTRPSFMVGGILEYDFTENLGIGTGLELQGKGTNDVFYNTPIYYLQVPVQLLYRSDGYFIAFGPYVAYAISGKYIEDGGDTINLLFGNGTKDDFTSTDYGATLEAGYEYRQFRAIAFYSLGLANIIPQDVRPSYTDGATVKNSVFGVTLNHFFGY